MGFFTAPRAFDLLRSHKVSLTDALFADIETIFNDLEREAGRVLMKDAGERAVRYERSLDMRFVGQGSEINVPAPEGPFTSLGKNDVRRSFDDVYEKLFGRTYPDSEVEFINFKVRASLPVRLLQLPKVKRKEGQSLDGAIKGERQAYSPKAGDFIPYTVYDRYKLFPDARFAGPAIIEEKESTLVIGEDSRVSVDEFGFLWVDLREV